jgi:hypothetical protein
MQMLSYSNSANFQQCKHLVAGNLLAFSGIGAAHEAVEQIVVEGCELRACQLRLQWSELLSDIVEHGSQCAQGWVGSGGHAGHRRLHEETGTVVAVRKIGQVKSAAGIVASGYSGEGVDTIKVCQYEVQDIEWDERKHSRSCVTTELYDAWVLCVVDEHIGNDQCKWVWVVERAAVPAT